MTSHDGPQYGGAPDPWGQPASGQEPGAYSAQPPAQGYPAGQYGQYGHPVQPPYGRPVQSPGVPPYGQQPYGYGYPYSPPQRTNGMAIASMVLGILWIYWIGSILALIFGYVARTQIRERGEAGNGMAIAGIVLGWVGIGFLGLTLVVAIGSSV
jgi:hypothetical protein